MWWKSYNRFMIQQFSGDVGTHNVDRIFRLPGTVNRPDAKKRARGRVESPARLLHSSSTSYDSLLDFNSAPVLDAV